MWITWPSTKSPMHTSQYRIFLSATAVYTTSVLTILSKNMPDHLGLRIMMLWFIALCVSILQQLPEELIMVCNLFSRTGNSCQQELLSGKGRGCLPALLSQSREDRSVKPLGMHSKVPARWTENSCFSWGAAVGPNSIKTDFLLSFYQKYKIWLKEWVRYQCFYPPVHSHQFKTCPWFQESSDATLFLKSSQL